MPKGVYPRPPDDPAVVKRIRSLYESGLTIAEVQRQVPGIKVQRVMAQHGIPRRRAIRRNQTGTANHMWRGDSAGYQALHLRVEAARGKPQKCQWCGVRGDTLRYEWANLTGNYADVNDYIRLCVSCHRRYDAQRRRETGQRTSPPRKGVMSNV